MLFADSYGILKSSKGMTKSDPSTLGLIFMAFLCAVLPLDISQLSFAMIGAVLYASLQNYDNSAQKTQTKPTRKEPQHTAVNAVPRYVAPHGTRHKAAPNRPSCSTPHAKPSATLSPKAQVRTPSALPIVAPTFQSKDWEGEMQELLLNITPTPEGQQVVQQLAGLTEQTIKSAIPEVEVSGFAHGNLTSGRAFGVAVPEVDIVANVDPRILFERLHGHKSNCSAQLLDVKKLHKCAIRMCTDRLVANAGFKFRRSAFRGQEPKVTLLAPATFAFLSEAIPIDFSVNVVTPLYNAVLLNECEKMDRRSKELILIVRRWAKDRGICHAAKGHLAPYTWGILVIYFLQAGVSDSPLLPPLESLEMVAGILPKSSRSKEVQVSPKHPQWRATQQAECHQSPGVLFKDFIKFFATQFDWEKEAVSVRAGRRAPPSLDLPLHIIVAEDSGTSQVGPSIEDPFHVAQNLADGMTIASYARLKEELSRAKNLCMRGASVSELLEPWIPAESDIVAASHDEPADKLCKSTRDSPLEQPCKSESEKAPLLTTPPWRRQNSSDSSGK